MMETDEDGFALEEEDLAAWAYEYAYKDGRINVSSLVNDLEIPTIGLLNGPGFHSEIVLMCDISLMAEEATIFDLHYDIGSVPADGIHSCFQELLGVKRAAYALLTGEAFDAKTALEYGMVNEIGIQMFGHLAKAAGVHGQEHIHNTVDYVREGRRNNFD
jgi:enoyl-CoA hydratase/carnithine racemase